MLEYVIASRPPLMSESKEANARACQTLQCGPNQPPANLWPIGWEWGDMQDQTLVCEMAGCGCTGPAVACSRGNAGVSTLYGAFATHCAGACQCEPQYVRMGNVGNGIEIENLRTQLEAARIRRAQLLRDAERLRAEAAQAAQAEDAVPPAQGPPEKRAIDDIAASAALPESRTNTVRQSSRSRAPSSSK